MLFGFLDAGKLAQQFRRLRAGAHRQFRSAARPQRAKYVVGGDGLERAREGVAGFVPASFHNGSCSFSFADGHCQMHQWKDARTRKPVNYRAPAINVYPTPNNADSLWLAQHATVQLDVSQGGEYDDENYPD